MEENPLKPPLREENLQRISTKVFSDPLAIEKFEPIPPYRKTNTYLCNLKSKQQVILKFGPKEEWENQKIAAKLNLHAPKTTGGHLLIREEKEIEGKKEPEVEENVWFAMEFIRESVALNELMKNEGLNKRVVDSFDKATRLLARIHNSLEPFTQQTELPRFTEEMVTSAIEERLERFNEALEKYDQIKEGDTNTALWRSYLKRADKVDLIHTFVGEEDSEVLVRWDYKPDNLLVQDQNGNKIFSIDWRGLHIGAHWIDLGFLLSDLPKDKRHRHLKTYLKTRKLDMNRGVALKNLQTAVVAAQFIHASSNASTLIKDIHTDYNLKRLATHLNQLGQELKTV